MIVERGRLRAMLCAPCFGCSRKIERDGEEGERGRTVKKESSFVPTLSEFVHRSPLIRRWRDRELVRVRRHLPP